MVYGLEFEVSGLSFRVKVHVLECFTFITRSVVRTLALDSRRVIRCSRCRRGFSIRTLKIEDLGFRIYGLGFRVYGLWFRVWGLGFRVYG